MMRFFLLALLAATTLNAEVCNGHLKYGEPLGGQVDQVLCFEAYASGYDYQTRIPLWTASHLTKKSVKGYNKRSNQFYEEKQIPGRYRSRLSDYRGSGMDRGHMASAASHDFSKKAMQETFSLANIAPQIGPGFNRGVWANLEKYIRTLTKKRGEIYMITGALVENKRKTIGNGVVVPTHFYKIVYDPKRQEAMAILLPHQKYRGYTMFKKYVVSIDEIERRTGLDFFSKLDDTLENRIEKQKKLLK